MSIKKAWGSCPYYLAPSRRRYNFVVLFRSREDAECAFGFERENEGRGQSR